MHGCFRGLDNQGSLLDQDWGALQAGGRVCRMGRLITSCQYTVQRCRFDKGMARILLESIGQTTGPQFQRTSPG